MDIYIIFIDFILFSFIGWICEVIYCSIGARHLVNRGMLYGPICPIYGFGALLILFLFKDLVAYPIALFLASFVGTSVIEYLTSYILEKIFDLKLWDYSSHKININGRVCLLNSSLFGIMSLVLIYLIKPYFLNFFNELLVYAKKEMAIILLIIFAIDILMTLASMIHLTKIIKNEKVYLLNLKEKFNNKYNNKFSKKIFFHFFKKFPGIKSIKKSRFFESIKMKFMQIKDKIKNSGE